MTVIKHDTFTVESDTPAENHTSDSGGSWTQGYTTRFTAYAATDSLGQEITGLSNMQGSETPPSADYFIEVWGTLGSLAQTERFGCVLAGAGAFHYEIDGYAFYIAEADGWRLGRYKAGVQSFPTSAWYDLGFNAANGVGAATNIHLRLQREVIDASTVRITAWIELDGGGLSQVAQIDDTSADRVSAVGRVGVYSNGLNWRISEFNAETLLTLDDPPNMTLETPASLTGAGFGT